MHKRKTNQIRNTSFKEDLSGKTFNDLTAIRWEKGKGWFCKCKCGNTTFVRTTSLKKGLIKSCGCRNYSTKNIKDMSNFENDHIKVIGQDLKVKGKYPYWICLCKHCGRKFKASGRLLRNYNLVSCGCIHSKGEQRIIKLLDDNEINYSKEYTFNDLNGVGGKKLRFDFAIFDKNNNLKNLIEYNVKQHYGQPDGRWSDEFYKTIHHDTLKKDYCIKNKIEWRIIRYYQDVD